MYKHVHTYIYIRILGQTQVSRTKAFNFGLLHFTEKNTKATQRSCLYIDKSYQYQAAFSLRCVNCLDVLGSYKMHVNA